MNWKVVRPEARKKTGLNLIVPAHTYLVLKSDI